MNTEELLNKFEWETITHYMDDELREQTHMELAPTDARAFLERYIELHEQKFSQPFTIN